MAYKVNVIYNVILQSVMQHNLDINDTKCECRRIDFNSPALVVNSDVSLKTFLFYYRAQYSFPASCNRDPYHSL